MSLRQRFPICARQRRKDWTVWRAFISTSFVTPSPAICCPTAQRRRTCRSFLVIRMWRPQWIFTHTPVRKPSETPRNCWTRCNKTFPCSFLTREKTREIESRETSRRLEKQAISALLRKMIYKLRFTTSQNSRFRKLASLFELRFDFYFWKKPCSNFFIWG